MPSVPPPDLERAPAPGQWSVRQIALHIVDAEIVGAVRLRMLAAQPGAKLAAYEGDVWGRELHYDAQPLEPALRLFASLRETTASMLRQLAPGAWAHAGVHEESGEVTLESLLLSHCQHAESHLEEIEELVSRMKESARQSNFVGSKN